jgi:hypothetical protein
MITLSRVHEIASAAIHMISKGELAYEALSINANY